MARVKVPNTPSIRRMPTYLHKLIQMQRDGFDYVSTTQVADYMDLDQIMVRKDFALTGLPGISGVGYKTRELIEAVKHYLGWDKIHNACLVGTGSLGSALLGYDFDEHGMRISIAFDSDPKKIGATIHGHTICDAADIPAMLKTDPPDIAILCVPAAAAQTVADRLVANGIKAIWDFSNVCLKTPPHVMVQREVIAGGLAVLTSKMIRSKEILAKTTKKS